LEIEKVFKTKMSKIPQCAKKSIGVGNGIFEAQFRRRNFK